MDAEREVGPNFLIKWVHQKLNHGTVGDKQINTHSGGSCASEPKHPEEEECGDFECQGGEIVVCEPFVQRVEPRIGNAKPTQYIKRSKG